MAEYKQNITLVHYNLTLWEMLKKKGGALFDFQKRKKGLCDRGIALLLSTFNWNNVKYNQLEDNGIQNI